MYLTWQDKAICFDTLGQGENVVLLHGFLESSAMWESFAKEWAKSYRVITIDLPGHGNSGHLEGISINDMADMVNEVLVHLEIEKASMVGHSMGGYVALAFADKYMDFVDRLVLYHSTAHADSLEGLLRRDKAIEMLDAHPTLYIRQTLTGLFWPKTVKRHQQALEKMIDCAIRNHPQGYSQAVAAMKNRPDRRHVLGGKVPVLFIAGQHDPVIPVELSEQQIKSISNGWGDVLQKSGHMSFIEQPEEAMQKISQFLQFRF